MVKSTIGCCFAILCSFALVSAPCAASAADAKAGKTVAESKSKAPQKPVKTADKTASKATGKQAAKTVAASAKAPAKPAVASTAKGKAMQEAKAESTKAASAKKTAKPAAAAQTTPDQDKRAEESFGTFQQDWMNKLHQFGYYGPSHVKVDEDENQKGSYVAKYTEVMEPQGSEVKKSGNKASPYVGTLKYERWDYVCRGCNPEEAKKGPFKPESRELITEVFRYSNGKWIY
jgi:hypothetical protein